MTGDYWRGNDTPSTEVNIKISNLFYFCIDYLLAERLSATFYKDILWNKRKRHL